MYNNTENNSKKSWWQKNLLNATGFPKITLIFFLLLFVVIINAVINYYYISKDRNNIKEITELINPYIEDLDRFNEMIIESKMYTTNWVYVPSSIEDKVKLDSIHRIAYPKLKVDLIAKAQLLTKDYYGEFDVQNLNLIFHEIDSIILLQQDVMKTLRTFDDYENPEKKFKAEEMVESNIFPRTEKVLLKLRVVLVDTKKNSSQLKESILTDSYRITNILIILSIVLIFFIAISVYFIIVNIRRPTIQMKNVIDHLTKGELIETNVGSSDNIIGEIASSLNKLTESFKKTAAFAHEIESGNLTVKYEKLSDKDQLGEALINMRNSLSVYSNEMELKIKERTQEALQKGQEIEIQKLFYESVLSSIPLDIAIYDENKKYIYLNDVAVTDKVTREFLIGKSDSEYCQFKNIDISFAQKREEFFDLAKQKGLTTEFEDNIVRENGLSVWKLRRFSPVFEGGQFRYMIAYGLDITEKKKDEIQIKESLEEKESLLGEIHHRVKNNLTLVLGLIEMQRDRQIDEMQKSQFNEIKNRIYAMSLIHDKMYKSHSFANIELQDYLKDLVTSISRFYGKGKGIALKFQLESTSVKGKDAIPIALLMNEVVTNSFKYAFNTPAAEQGGGTLFVSLHRNSEIAGGLVLSVKDNGPGLPEGIDLSKSQSLGFKLIHIFVKQLKGELNYFNDGGLNFVIKFKL